jgi:hypothetical protein
MPVVTKPEEGQEVAEPGQTPRDSVDDDHNFPVWRWVIRRGDNFYRACRDTYGECDEKIRHTILAYNPQIKSIDMIRSGDVILMPAIPKSASSNHP